METKHISLSENSFALIKYNENGVDYVEVYGRQVKNTYARIFLSEDDVNLLLREVINLDSKKHNNG